MRVPFAATTEELAQAAMNHPRRVIVVSGDPGRSGLRPYLALAWLPVAAETMFEMVVHPDGLQEYMGLLREVKQLKRGGGIVETRFVGGVKAGPIKLTFGFDVEMDERYPELVYRRVTRGDLRDIDFAHRVDELDGGTLLQSSYDLDLGQVSVLGIRPFRGRTRFNNLAVAGTAYSMVQAFVDMAGS